MKKNKFKLYKGLSKVREVLQQDDLEDRLADAAGDLYGARMKLEQIKEISKKYRVRLNIQDLIVEMREAENRMDGLVMEIGTLNDRLEELEER